VWDFFLLGLLWIFCSCLQETFSFFFPLLFVSLSLLFRGLFSLASSQLTLSLEGHWKWTRFEFLRNLSSHFAFRSTSRGL